MIKPRFIFGSDSRISPLCYTTCGFFWVFNYFTTSIICNEAPPPPPPWRPQLWPGVPVYPSLSPASLLSQLSFPQLLQSWKPLWCVPPQGSGRGRGGGGRRRLPQGGKPGRMNESGDQGRTGEERGGLGRVGAAGNQGREIGRAHV